MRRRFPRSSSQVPRDFVEVFVERAPLSALDRREAIEDCANVESHPQRRFEDCFLVHRLELPHGDGHPVRLDQGQRVADGQEALRVRRQLPEHEIRIVAERADVHPEPLPRLGMEARVIDVAVEEPGLRRLGGFRGTRVGEGAPRETSLGAEHQVLVCEHVADRVELAVLRDPDEDMTAFLAHGDEALHEREVLRELGQGAVDRDDRALDLVREVDCELPLDEPAVLVHHVPRLVLERAFRKLEERAMEVVLFRHELLEGRDADHPLDEPPIRAVEATAVERVPEQAHGDEGEPPAREVQQERVRSVHRNHVPRLVGWAEHLKLGCILRRKGHIAVVFHEELELPAHVIDVTHARTSARDSWSGVIVTRIRPGNRSATSARCVIRMTFSKNSPIRRSFWTNSSRDTSVSRDPRSPSSMNKVFMRPNVRPICGIDASSRAIANRKAALIWVFSPPLNSATSCHWPSTPCTRIRTPWPRPSSYVSRRIRLNRPSVSSERFFDASISSSGKSCSTAYITTPRLWNTRFTSMS